MRMETEERGTSGSNVRWSEKFRDRKRQRKREIYRYNEIEEK